MERVLIVAAAIMVLGLLLYGTLMTHEQIDRYDLESLSAVRPSEDWFRERIQGTSKLVLVDFWAPWCGPCRQLKPLLTELQEAYPEQLIVLPIDVDEHQPLSADYDVKGIPFLMLFKEGRVVAAEPGLLSYRELELMIEEHLADDKSPAVSPQTSGVAAAVEVP